jgi:hypothetical protein
MTAAGQDFRSSWRDVSGPAVYVDSLTGLWSAVTTDHHATGVPGDTLTIRPFDIDAHGSPDGLQWR